MENVNIAKKDDSTILAISGLIVGILFGFLIGVNGAFLITAVMLVIADASGNNAATAAGLTIIGALIGMCVLPPF